MANQGPKGGISGPLHQLRPAWEQLTGAKLEILMIPVAELLNKTLTGLQFGGAQFDGVIQGAWFMGEYVTADLLRPIDDFVGDKRFPHWDPEWLPDTLLDLHAWDGKMYGVLNDSDGQVLYWRHDILTNPQWQERFKKDTGQDMPFPVRTWRDVIDIARFFHGKTWDTEADSATQGSESDPGTGVVLHLKVNEYGMFHFMSLSAPFTVIRGNRVDRGINNYWFDPKTMEPLINQPGHVRALETLIELAQYGPKAQVGWDIGTAWDWFLRGKCIFTYSFGDVGALAQDVARLGQGAGPLDPPSL